VKTLTNNLTPNVPVPPIRLLDTKLTTFISTQSILSNKKFFELFYDSNSGSIFIDNVDILVEQQQIDFEDENCIISTKRETDLYELNRSEELWIL